MSMSVDGLVSGMDTTSIISQLMSVEAGPQNALKTKLSATQTNASAYRTVNTTFLAITAAADTALKPDIWTTAAVRPRGLALMAFAASATVCVPPIAIVPLLTLFLSKTWMLEAP